MAKTIAKPQIASKDVAMLTIKLQKTSEIDMTVNKLHETSLRLLLSSSFIYLQIKSCTGILTNKLLTLTPPIFA